MEWNGKEINWIEGHREDLEKDRIEFVIESLRFSGKVNQEEKKHIAIGIALVKGLPIELKVEEYKDNYGLTMYQTKLQIVLGVDKFFTISANSYDEDPSDLWLVNDYTEDLKYIGLQPETLTRVIGNIKVKRGG